MTKYILVSFLFIACFFLNSCGTLKDGFQNPKKDNSDEFLVEKKSPLIMPPEFDKLPVPDEKKDLNVKEDNLKKLITENQEIFEDKISNKKLEDSVLEKIRSN